MNCMIDRLGHLSFSRLVIFAGLTKSVAFISVITEMRGVMSQKVKFAKLWDQLANIQKDQDEKNSLAKNQPVSENW